MSQVFAAKYAVPHMLAQGSGYLLNVASAAGLLVIFDLSLVAPLRRFEERARRGRVQRAGP